MEENEEKNAWHDNCTLQCPGFQCIAKHLNLKAAHDQLYKVNNLIIIVSMSKETFYTIDKKPMLLFKKIKDCFIVDTLLWHKRTKTLQDVLLLEKNQL